MENLSLGTDKLIETVDMYMREVEEACEKYSGTALKIVLSKIHARYRNEEFPQHKTVKFINQVNCIVKKPEETKPQVNGVGGMVKMMYQPVFYRTQDLQNIRLRAGVTQSIGVNLNQWMSKVETFKILIDGLDIAEQGRNDIYVLFKINAAMLTSGSGRYNIVTQDDEYISSGEWILF